MSIIGNTVGAPNPRPDWNQNDSKKADYIKNKPTELLENADAHMKNKSNPHGVTPAQIGAAPLTDTLTRRGNLTGGSNWDNAYEVGLYEFNTWTGSGGVGVPLIKTVGHLIVYSWRSSIPLAEQFVVQELHDYGNPNCVLRRICRNGTYTEWEWENPPMVPGVEYRTTERWQDKAVYTKLVDCGALPNAASKEVNLDFKPTYVLSHEICYVKNTFYYSSLSDASVYVASYGGNAMVRIISTTDLTEYHGYITIRYTKD